MKKVVSCFSRKFPIVMVSERLDCGNSKRYGASMSPVLPSMTEAILISDSDSWCLIFRKSMKAFYYTYQLVKYMFTDAGEITEEWKFDLCTTECADEEEVEA